ncbi:hypothetical protein FHS30_002733 [Simiduia aestuariiviva]|uniref:Uncharacterized protein n=1 Tax=Simiduia aestuariiviva TaxID=1510459 RepID=A0A839UST3_9GAMM|nr:hypothetical protein [Simiduia aestuariiviva]
MCLLEAVIAENKVWNLATTGRKSAVRHRNEVYKQEAYFLLPVKV